MSITLVAMPSASRALVVLAFAALCSPPSAASEDDDPITLDALRVQWLEPLPHESERALTPGAVTIIDAASLATRSVNNLSDALRYVPGIWAESTNGGSAMVISSRGSNLDATGYDNNGVRLLQDGLPVTAADGNNHNRFLDPLAMRYAVVAKGANALTYGASTLGGAIDFATPTAHSTAPLQIFVNRGSHGLGTARFTAGSSASEMDGLLTFERKLWGGYRNHSSQERSSVYANTGWNHNGDMTLRLSAAYVDNNEELPGALTRAQAEADPSAASSSAIHGNVQWNVTTERLALRGDWNIDRRQRLEFGISHEDQTLYHPIIGKVMADPDGNGPMPPTEVFSLLRDTNQSTIGAMVRHNLLAGNHDILTGLNLASTHEQGGNFRNDAGRPNGQTETINNRAHSAELFLVDRWAFAPASTLVYGTQAVLTTRDVRTAHLASGKVRNPAGRYASLNPRVGLLHQIGAMNQAYASLSRLYEAPTQFNMEDDVRGGDALLDAMHGAGVEFGMRGSTVRFDEAVRLHWDVALHYARIRDDILSIEDPSVPGTSLSVNVDRTTRAGLEAVMGGSFVIWGTYRFEPMLSATLNRHAFDDDSVYGDNALPSAPSYALRGEAMYHQANGFFMGPTFDFIGSRYADFSNSYRLAPYYLVGLRGGVRRSNWEMVVEMRNALDTNYAAGVSVRDRATLHDAILQPGAPRSLYVGLNLRF